MPASIPERRTPSTRPGQKPAAITAPFPSSASSPGSIPGSPLRHSAPQGFPPPPRPGSAARGSPQIIPPPPPPGQHRPPPPCGPPQAHFLRHNAEANCMSELLHASEHLLSMHLLRIVHCRLHRTKLLRAVTEQSSQRLEFQASLAKKTESNVFEEAERGDACVPGCGPSREGGQYPD